MDREKLKKQKLIINLFLLVLVWAFFSQPAESVDNASYFPTVILDPGHGGMDTGVIGLSGGNEKTVSFKIAEFLKDELPQNYRVYLTRDGDYSLNDKERCAFANEHNGDLFISIHTGGAFSRSLNETAVYRYGNDTAGINETSEDFLWDELQFKYENDGERLSDILLEYLKQFVSDTPFLNEKAKKATEVNAYKLPLYSLNGCDMPAVVIETGRLTTPFFESAILNKDMQKETARTIAKAVEAFFKKKH